MDGKIKGYIGAFVVGGLIGVVGQLIVDLFGILGIPFPIFILTGIFALAFIAVLLFFAGIHQKIDKVAGMGSAIPISGLSAAVAGIIFGERMGGASIGKAIKTGLAAPVKLFGSAFVVAFILALISVFVMS